MRLVILESPYAGDIETNVTYARSAIRDSLGRGEAPIASHLLYTQPGILRDDVPSERRMGIDAGLAWRSVAEAAVFYIDLGWSPGMRAALDSFRQSRIPYEIRTLWPPAGPMDRIEHLLTCLSEECNEVGQRISKALRFGRYEIQRDQSANNISRIEPELKDLTAVANILANEGIIRTDFVAAEYETAAKLEKIEGYMLLARQHGALLP